MQSGTKMFTVDKFTGINEAADGYTELNMGQASKMENFLITDSFNLTLRPGVRRMDFLKDRAPAPILASWAGFLSEDAAKEHMVVVDFFDGVDRIFVYERKKSGGFTVSYSQTGTLGLDSGDNAMVKIFPFGGKLWVMSRGNTVSYRDGQFYVEAPYVPLVIAGASPSGGGTSIENINLLTGLRRIDYSADGTSTVYVLPEEAVRVEKIVVDNVPWVVELLGAFDADTHTFTFNEAPEKGVGNVEITYGVSDADAEKTRLQVLSQPLVEAYNGSTDTRLFVGGNGNVLYYTGVTQSGEVTAMYFPAMNEIAVDMTGAAVTGIVRHYGKLLVFTRDGTYSVSYEPVTITDGSTVAGFYLRSVNREFGNDVPGQVRTVNNYPRTVTGDGVYEWKITSSYYQDERYAQRVSDAVQKTFHNNADVSRIVTCDDNYSKTYYVFLNDEEGTVLVNRYAIAKENVWCIYKGALFTDVKNAFVFDGNVLFSGETEIFYFDKSVAKDAPLNPEGESTQIRALWESGFMHFGSDFRRKFTSQIYVSMLPQSNSEMIITAQTDRRDEYMEKTVSNNVFTFFNLDFSRFTFNTNNTPKIQKVRLKVKKFVYYKLIFRVERPGATATVLGYDQQIRFGAMAK